MVIASNLSAPASNNSSVIALPKALRSYFLDLPSKLQPAKDVISSQVAQSASHNSVPTFWSQLGVRAPMASAEAGDIVQSSSDIAAFVPVLDFITEASEPPPPAPAIARNISQTAQRQTVFYAISFLC